VNDDELRPRFEALRREDSRDGPDFSALWNRARVSQLTDRRGLRSSRRWVAVAAGFLIVAALLVGETRYLKRDRQRAAEAVPISTWQSPTAGLLQTPATSVLVSRPLLSSVFDPVTSATFPLKTD
jgi:hypothetical protein